ncbi:hypothetical protein WN51_01600 [Melipona quadrifasciata]|uniref:Uncharacterized protein n=1 Tax=Melipona quadrifasciata TaxID=166423 RepID=A0A0M8ZUN8_9HYME|nr:hypothetical protein WN51_01600 [Melipona quadrifasciata]
MMEGWKKEKAKVAFRLGVTYLDSSSGADGSDSCCKLFAKAGPTPILARFRTLLCLTSEIGRTSTLGAQPFCGLCYATFALIGPIEIDIGKSSSPTAFDIPVELGRASDRVIDKRRSSIRGRYATFVATGNFTDTGRSILRRWKEETEREGEKDRKRSDWVKRETRIRPLRAERDGMMDARTGRKRRERRWQWELKRAVGSISGKFRALCSFGPDTASVSIPASVKKRRKGLEKEEERRLQVSKKGIRGRKVDFELVVLSCRLGIESMPCQDNTNTSFDVSWYFDV